MQTLLCCEEHILSVFQCDFQEETRIVYVEITNRKQSYCLTAQLNPERIKKEEKTEYIASTCLEGYV